MLRLVSNLSTKDNFLAGNSESSEALNDHLQLLDRYLQSHRIRNHSEKTIRRTQTFLNSWFNEHGNGEVPLYTWKAMAPKVGRKRVIDYANALIENELTSGTVRSYLNMLSQYFSYVIEYPYLIIDNKPERIEKKYHTIEHPVSEYDIPKHVYDGERLGIPLDPEKLYDFYAQIRKIYLNNSKYKSIRSRDYAMVVLAGETGLRIDEILHLEVSKDLFFDSNKLQTRFAKGTKGSGKKARITLFPPLARDTIRFYQKNHRPKLLQNNDNDYLFISKFGELMTYESANDAMNKMVKEVQSHGFSVASHMSWHWMRRIFATRFIERFPNQLSILVNLLGHLSPNTVHCYIRHSDAWIDEKIKTVLQKGVSWPSVGN